MPNEPTEITKLKQQLDAADLPRFVEEKVRTQLSRLSSLSSNDFQLEADRTIRWVDWIISLPWTQQSPGHLDLNNARQILDQNHHGLEEIKERILEYLSVLKLNSNAQRSFHAPILLLVGLVGTGKTTLAYSIAKSLNRPIARIPFGGIGSAQDLRGQSRLHLDSEPGQIIKALRKVQVNNPVILLDELDRVATEARHDIMGVLVELLDPEQNQSFLDHYLDVPFNLSQVLFVCTANNTGNIATAVLDRMEPISMPSYTDEDKIAIAKNFLLPNAIHNAGLPNGALTIDQEVWPLIVRPLGYDAGIRTLQHTIQALARKTAKSIVTGQNQAIHINKDNLKNFIKTW